MVATQEIIGIMSTTFMFERNAGARNDVISGDAVSGVGTSVSTERMGMREWLKLDGRILKLKDGTISHHDAKTSQPIITPGNLLFWHAVPLHCGSNQCRRKLVQDLRIIRWQTAHSIFPVHKQYRTSVKASFDLTGNASAVVAYTHVRKCSY